MAAYRLEFSHEAERMLSRMKEREFALYERVERALDDLEKDPFLGKPLKGELKGKYSYRVGSYRILYLVHKHELLVLIIDIGHRRDVYK